MNEYEIRAQVTAEYALNMLCKHPNILSDWYEGRACASALICDIPEVQAARNEAVFLSRDYNRRHFK